ncbi:unnamed protein product, partial [Candidula unifasciata]
VLQFIASVHNESIIYTVDSDTYFIAHYNGNFTDEIPPRCAFPQVNPYDPSIMKISGIGKRTINCEGEFMPDITYIEGGKKLMVNVSRVKKYFTTNDFKECSYINIYRHVTDDNDYKLSEWSKPFNDSVELFIDTEFIKVACKNNKSDVVSKNFYTLIPKREQFDESDFLNLKKRQVVSSPKETLNVIMVGMDTLARNQFLRGCNKTYSYLMNSLKSFDLTMHSQLGSNTFDNFLPLFAGESYDQIAKWWSDKYHLDNIDLLWGSFEKAGYRTLYTEDWPGIGAFHYFKKSFRNKFARYNTRPLTLAMSEEINFYKRSRYCAGNQVEMNFLLNYVLLFLDTFQDNPVFSVAMITKPTHNYPTDAKMFDEHLFNFYRSLNQSGHLNKSLLVSFSDHGVRWGPLRDSKYGFFESRTPYTILTFPDWFLRKYPDVAANLKVNSKRLTSHFDTYATLLDLLYFKSNSSLLPKSRRSISLFDKIPWDRTCEDASVPQEFCLCGYQNLADVDTKSPISKALAELVIEALNSKTDKNICASFKVDQIIHVLNISLSEANSNGETTLYKVNLQVTPGYAIFEASVYATTNSADFRVANSIDRLNLYEGQADCMQIAMYKPFCYCKNLLPKKENTHHSSLYLNITAAPMK